MMSLLLAGYFCEQCRLRMGLAWYCCRARNLLQHYSFPGNVRELEHAIHRAVVLSRATRSGDEVIPEAQHFQFAVAAPMLPTETAAAAPVNKTCVKRQKRSSEKPLARRWRRIITTGRRPPERAEMDVANLHRLAKRLGKD